METRNKTLGPENSNNRKLEMQRLAHMRRYNTTEGKGKHRLT